MGNSQKSIAWKWFSHWVRLSNADENGMVKCFTCDNVKHWTEMDAGHFMSRRHNSTFINELNVKNQCSSCNRWLNGNSGVFAVNLDKLHGQGTAESLIELSKKTVNYSESDWKELSDKYRLKVKELEKK